jgi:hypothetical protein
LHVRAIPFIIEQPMTEPDGRKFAEPAKRLKRNWREIVFFDSWCEQTSAFKRFA